MSTAASVIVVVDTVGPVKGADVLLVLIGIKSSLGRRSRVRVGSVGDGIRILERGVVKKSGGRKKITAGRGPQSTGQR